MSNTLQIQLDKQAMLSGKALVLRPLWAIELGGVLKALLYEQLIFRSGGLKAGDKPSVRFSYTKLQEQLPFFTKRWIIEAVKELEAYGVVTVERGSRVNKYVLNLDVEWVATEADGKNTASMLVFPELAIKVGLLEAIVLQQVHLRHWGADGSIWVIRSLREWHQNVFMFVSEVTVKRLFSKLRDEGLIFVGTYKAESGLVGKYRVNYVRVAEALGIPIPTTCPPPFDPSPWASNDWTDPLVPFSEAEKKKMKAAENPIVH